MKKNYAYWYDLCFRDADNDAAYVRKFCDSCCEGPVLELASGTGRLAAYGNSPRMRYLELSEGMGEVFVRNHPDKKDALLLGSAGRIPLPDSSLAGIYVPFNGINELNPIIFTLKEFHRALKSDGKLLICAANPDFPMLRSGTVRTGVVDPGDGKPAFQFDGRTFKTPFGRFSWQTRLGIRTAEEEFTFSIDQYLINREKLEDICVIAGFKVDSVHGDYGGGPWTPGSQWTLLTMSKTPAATSPAGDEHLRRLTTTYDTVAPGYDGFAEKGHYVVPAWLAAKLPELKLIRPRILDLGCANGNLGRIASDNYPGCVLSGLDVSPVMISELGKRGLYRGAMPWDLNRGLPFTEAEYFDLAFAFGVLEFLNDPGPLFSALSETLRPTASLLCSFEVLDEKAGAERSVMDPRIGFPRFRYAESDARALLSRHKFEVVSCERKTAYKSPSTGVEVDYLLVHAKRDRNLA